MTHQFKPGELAFSFHDGFCVCKESTVSQCPIEHGRETYLADGREYDESMHPNLLTVSQAALLGYYPVGLRGEAEALILAALQQARNEGRNEGLEEAALVFEGGTFAEDIRALKSGEKKGKI